MKFKTDLPHFNDEGKSDRHGCWKLTNWQDFKSILEWDKRCVKVEDKIFLLDYNSGNRMNHLIYKKGKPQYYSIEGKFMGVRNIYIYRTPKKIPQKYLKILLALKIDESNRKRK